MPYIKPDKREDYDDEINALFVKLRDNNFNEGDINYCLSKLIWSIFNYNYRYAEANKLLGILEAVKLEFYRKKIVCFEDKKCDVNGDLDIYIAHEDKTKT